MPDTQDPPFPPVWPFSVFSPEGFSPNIRMFRGDQFTFSRAVYDANGSAVNISGKTIRMTAKYTPADPDASAVFTLTSPSSGITITSAAGGRYQVIIPATATSALAPHPVDLQYDIQIANSAGNPQTVMRGVLTVEPDISQTAP